MSDQELIESLSSNLKQVRVKSLLRLNQQYLLTLTFLGVILVYFLKINDDFWSDLQSLGFSASITAPLLAIITGSYCLAWVSRPGLKVPKLAFSCLLSSVALSGVIQTFRMFGPGSKPEFTFDNGWICLAIAIGVSLSVIASLVYLLRKQAPVHERWVTPTLLLLASSLGALVLQLHCPNTNPIHEFLWHIGLPWVALFFLRRAVSKQTFNW